MLQLTRLALAALFIGPLGAASGSAAQRDEPQVDQARRAWRESPHGPMLERILPPAMAPRDMPEASSAGARLTARYCIQCHYLPNPAMHTAERWKSVVERMVWRMRGNGNMGALMKDMMGRVDAPSDAEVETLTRYLEKYGQHEIPSSHPALRTERGEMFAIACSQCHALPDPRRHTAREWPAIVERMRRHMAWTNTIVGSPELRTTPELRTGDIVRLLQQYARPEKTNR